MKIHRLLWAAAALPLLQLARADVPFSTHSLGMLEATLAYCARSDPDSALKYQERATRLVRGMLEAELVKARDTQEYKESYSSIADTLSGAPKDQVKETCAELLSRNDGFAKGRK
jgi:hypothetical protein